MPINLKDLPVGSIVAATNAVAIKRFDRTDQEEYWMPAEGYPLPLSNQQMQLRVDKDASYEVLRTGTSKEN